MEDLSGETITVAELRQYQSAALSGRSLWQTVSALGQHEPQSPPLFYAIEHVFDRTLNIEPPAIVLKRLLPVTLSLLGFPCAYWLCWQLFESATIARLGTALYAVSPIQFIYARELRMYGLWAVELMVLTAVFLLALRRPTRSRWIAYGLTAMVGLYTFPFTLFAIAAHGVYLAAVDWGEWRKRFWRFAVSSFAALVLYSPWLWCIVNIDDDDMNDWRTKSIPLRSLVTSWAHNLVQAFYLPVSDPGTGNADEIVALALSGLAAIAVLCALFATALVLVRHRDRRAGFLLLLVAAIPFGVLAVSDLMAGGIRSIVDRYLMASYLSLQISVAAGLGRWFERGTPQSHSRRAIGTTVAAPVAIVLLVLGTVACWQLSRVPTMPHHARNENYREIARTLAANPDTPMLFVGESKHLALLTLSHELDDTTPIQLVHPKDIETVQQCQTQDVFAFVPVSDTRRAFLDRLEDRCQAQSEEIIPGAHPLWKLTPTLP